MWDEFNKLTELVNYELERGISWTANALSNLVSGLVWLVLSLALMLFNMVMCIILIFLPLLLIVGGISLIAQILGGY